MGGYLTISQYPFRVRSSEVESRESHFCEFCVTKCLRSSFSEARVVQVEMSVPLNPKPFLNDLTGKQVSF